MRTGRAGSCHHRNLAEASILSRRAIRPARRPQRNGRIAGQRGLADPTLDVDDRENHGDGDLTAARRHADAVRAAPPAGARAGRPPQCNSVAGEPVIAAEYPRRKTVAPGRLLQIWPSGTHEPTGRAEPSLPGPPRVRRWRIAAGVYSSERRGAPRLPERSGLKFLLPTNIKLTALWPLRMGA